MKNLTLIVRLVIVALLTVLIIACNVQGVTTNLTPTIVESTVEIPSQATATLHIDDSQDTSSGLPPDTEIILGNDLINTQWQLVELNGEPFPEDMKLTLLLTPEKVHGYTGCNNWEIWGIFTAQNGAIFTNLNIVSDAGGCLYPELQKKFAFAFTSATTYSFEDNLLHIQNGNGEQRIIFSPLDE